MPELTETQKMLLQLVTQRDRDVYLVGGTALTFHFKHRFSEDLDFFVVNDRWSEKFHVEMTKYIQNKTGHRITLRKSRRNKGHKWMATYDYHFEGDKAPLKIDFVQDPLPLIEPREENGLASIPDIYLRKIYIVVGSAYQVDDVGRKIPMGRMVARDVFDIYYLSKDYEQLSVWFPKQTILGSALGIKGYEKLVSWYRSFDRMELMTELIENILPEDTKDDPKKIITYLDNEILHELNKVYVKFPRIPRMNE